MTAIAFADLPPDFTCGQAKKLLETVNGIFATELASTSEREQAAIASWDEERKRALREAARVIEANRLLEECFGFVNPPLADAISKYLSQFNP